MVLKSQVATLFTVLPVESWWAFTFSCLGIAHGEVSTVTHIQAVSTEEAHGACLLALWPCPASWTAALTADRVTLCGWVALTLTAAVRPVVAWITNCVGWREN